MTIQEAKVCIKKGYPVHLTGEVDTFGYWTVDTTRPYIVKAIREFYVEELKQFNCSIEVQDPTSSVVYHVKEKNVIIDAGLKQQLEDDVRELKEKRLERMLQGMLDDGISRTAINSSVRATLDKLTKGKKTKRFVKPTIEEVEAYIKEKGYTFSAEKFYHHYESNGWVIGKNTPMKQWKSACATWELQQKDFKPKEPDRLQREPGFDIEAIKQDAAMNDNFDI